MKIWQTHVMYVTNWKMKTNPALDHQLIKFPFTPFFFKKNCLWDKLENED